MLNNNPPTPKQNGANACLFVISCLRIQTANGMPELPKGSLSKLIEIPTEANIDKWLEGFLDSYLNESNGNPTVISMKVEYLLSLCLPASQFENIKRSV
jgi:hypothetical protein